MALPLLNMLSLVSSAANAVQKVFSRGNQGAFDAELAAVMKGDAGSGTPLSKAVTEKGEIDDESLKSLLGTPSGFLLFQFTAALSEMGISAPDARLLLGGNGAQISDGGLATLLGRSGLPESEVRSILSNPELRDGIKASLSESFKRAIEAQASRDGIDPASLLEFATSDQAPIDSILLKLKAAAAPEQATAGEGLEALPAPSGQTAQASPADSATPSGPLVKLTFGLIQSSVSHTVSEIRTMVGQILKNAGVRTLTASNTTGSASAGPGTEAGVARMIDTARDAFGISEDELRPLFFETDPARRQEAVEQVTAKVGAFLKTREGTPLGPEVLHALSFMKKAMSETEFAGITNALSLWNAGQSLPDPGMPVNREMYASLARALGSRDPAGQFEAQMKQVVDQLRQAVPSQANGTGTQVTLKLNPPMLGQVDVSMTMADGQLQATFKTDQLVTRDMLVQNMSILKDALADQGIRATQFSVSMNLDSRGQQGDAYLPWTGPEGGSRGFGHQGRGRENAGRAFREEESTAYTQASYPGAVIRGLDFFA